METKNIVIICITIIVGSCIIAGAVYFAMTSNNNTSIVNQMLKAQVVVMIVETGNMELEKDPATTPQSIGVIIKRLDIPNIMMKKLEKQQEVMESLKKWVKYGVIKLIC